MASVKAIRSSECILVLGMHRSGTSAVAGSLARGGIALGGDLLAPGEDNPKGYFEHSEAVRIDDALLDALDRRWDDIRPLPKGWEQSAPAVRACKEIRDWLAGEFTATPLFAIKDPRMCRVLPIWLNALDALSILPKILLVARHPAEVSASIEKRNGWPAVVSESLWLEYMSGAERGSRGRDRAVITYDRFLKAPVKELSAGLEKIGLAQAAQAMLATDLSSFVSQLDRHHNSGRGSAAKTEVGRLANEMYGLFEARANDSHLDLAEFDRLDASLREIQASVLSHTEGLSTMILASRRANEALQADIEKKQSELNAQIEWSEQAIKTRDDLHTELAEIRSKFLAQQDWSQQAVVEREKLQAELAGVQSELLAQQGWSQHAVVEREGIQAELAGVRSDLLAQQDWSRKAVAEREKLQAELAGVRSDLLAQQKWSVEAVAEREKLQAELAGVRSDLLAQQKWSVEAVAEREKLQAELAGALSDRLTQEESVRRIVSERERLQAELTGVHSNLLVQQEQSRQIAVEREGLQVELIDAKTRIREKDELSQEMAGKLEALHAQLHASSLHVDQLQFRLNRYESTWFGRLHRWWTGRAAGEPDSKEKDE